MMKSMYHRSRYLILLSLLYLTIDIIYAEVASSGPRYYHTPMHEVTAQPLYLKTTNYDEIIIAFAEKGTDLREGDYLTHADGIRVLNGGLQSFLKSNEKEAVVPIIEEKDTKQGGARFLGFLLVQIVQPRKLSTRRGEIAFDLEEGGPSPSLKLGNIVVGADGARTTNDPAYLAPPHGSGACITGRDCYNFNGTCVNGQCSCLGPFTGTYCQLNRPDFAAAAIMKNRANALKQKEKEKERDPNKGQTISRTQSTDNNNKTPPSTTATSTSNNNRAQNVASPSAANPAPNTAAAITQDTINDDNTLSTTAQTTQSQQPADQAQQHQQKVKKRKPKPKPKPTSDTTNLDDHSHDDGSNGDSREINDNNLDDMNNPNNNNNIIGTDSSNSMDTPIVILPTRIAEEEQALLTQQPPAIEDLYGEGRAYPEPFTAGRLPTPVLNDRHRRRLSREPFLYAVRYRSGPLGLTFDNNKSNATMVEKVLRGQQSELSDVREGDALVAVDAYNVSTAPARLTQRLLSSLPWPRILVFEARYKGEDPILKEGLLLKRTFNMTILYPPTLLSSEGDNMAFRTADWTPSFLTSLFTPQTEKIRHNVETAKIRGFCPLYRMVGVNDPFGCNPTVDKDKKQTSKEANEDQAYALTAAEEEIIKHNGFVSTEIEAQSRYLALLLQEAFVRKIGIEVRPAAIMKRGSCTFVEKAKTLPTHGAALGLVVNTDEELLDMPAGKEKTDGCNVPIGLLKLKDGNFLQQTSRGVDPIYVIASPYTPSSGDSTASKDEVILPEEEAGRLACERLQQLSEDLLDKWPHSIPSLSVTQILAIKPPDQSKVRGLTEEGGRVALSGANGWAFFDYHLAMFGPQEVPLGPHKLVMAHPPHGCDPNAYTVRITGSIVGILRGGGCSFGIKVINAQKLGAVAVMILNTDDAKTMRLMALPDEVPLIQIPCVMVSRRFQFYVEQQLKKYPSTVDLMLVSIQPTGVFGEYERKNTLVLPARLDNMK